MIPLTRGKRHICRAAFVSLARRARPAPGRPAVVDRGLFGLCCCALLVVSLVGCGSSKKNPHASNETGTEAVAGVTTFTDTSHGLRLTYPGDWEPMEVDKEDAILVLARMHDHEGTTMPPTVTLFAQPTQKQPEARDLDVL